jgi:hypothetical protein
MDAFQEKFMKRNTAGAIGLIIGVMLLMGCATTKVTSYWKDPGYHKQPHKVLVVALLRKKEYRTALENEFARQLNEKGLAVTTGSEAFPENTPGDKTELQKYLRDKGYDSFLLVRIVAWKDLLENTTDEGPTWPDFYSMDNDTPPPDAVVKERIAVARASFYDVATWKRFWTAATQTPTDEVNHDLMVDYVREIIKQMHSNGLVQ